MPKNLLLTTDKADKSDAVSSVMSTATANNISLNKIQNVKIFLMYYNGINIKFQVQDKSKATAIVGPVNMKLSNAAVTKKTKRTNESSDEV